MAKKYLLYIHDNERFDSEMYKSELVNKLLKAHWDKLPAGQYVAPIEDIEELKSDLRDDKSFQFCKHDAVLGMCKKGCR